MAITDYFLKTGARRHLLAEITRSDANATVYRFADQPYTTEPGDTPANCPYSAILAQLPELSRKLPDFFSGGAQTSFGTLELSDRRSNYTGTAVGYGEMTLPRGAEVTLKLAAPRLLFPFTDALVLGKGKVARVGGSSDGMLSVEMTDGSDAIERAVIPITTTPLGFGKVRNAEPFLTNPGLLVYTLHDGPINAVLAVYDDGVLIPGSGYTVNLTAATVTLNASPAGRVTVDFEGHKDGGTTYYTTTEQIIGELLDRAGFASLSRTFTSLPTGLIGLYLKETTTLGDLLTSLMRGCAGYWFIKSDGTFKAAQFPIPGTPGDVYNENNLLEEVDYSDDDRLHKEIRYAYQRNWTQYQSRTGASTTQADFSSRTWYEGTVVDGAPLAEYVYQTSPILETYFDLNGDAQTAATRYLNIFRQPRTILDNVLVPFLYTRELGDAITVEFDGLAFDGIVTGIVSRFDGDYPVQQLEVFA
jgi:hypothetical protein